MFYFIKKIKFDLSSDRLGPDIPFTHWNLYFKTRMEKLCRKKFCFFGKNSEFRPGAYAIYCSTISIGNNVVIRPGTMLFGDSRSIDSCIVIEDNVLLGAGIQIYVNNHIYKKEGDEITNKEHSLPKPVILRKGCWVGANSLLLPGVTIGEYAIVGAGSIVTKSIPPRCIAVGNPAVVIKQNEI